SKDWAIPLDGVGFGDKTAGVSSKLAYIDTGTSFIFAAPEDVKALHELIPDATSEDGVNWAVPCDTKENVVFIFSGKRYTVAPEDYISAAAGGGPCRSNIFGQEVVEDGWLLGDVFFKNVYAVFDVDEERIGMFLSFSPLILRRQTTDRLNFCRVCLEHHPREGPCVHVVQEWRIRQLGGRGYGSGWYRIVRG
ncbi:hypothetical protein IMZ48_02905, partial [Candidatus Bathyarchaeota archaeon]|nr:hypothetical protein [Candidatus Bathyarchaeota archaeon]